MQKKTRPTHTYTRLDTAYGHFNRKLFDGRTATAKYVEADVMMLGARISAYAANMGPRGAVAFISGSKEAFELASRFINLGKSGRPAKAFMSETEARKWLEEQIES